jgi:hypothetical protein
MAAKLMIHSFTTDGHAKDGTYATTHFDLILFAQSLSSDLFSPLG